MTQARDTQVLKVVRAVRALQSAELDFLNPSAEHGVSASSIAEHADIPVQRLRPLLTTMINQKQVFRVEAEATRPRKSRSGEQSSLTRKMNYYYVDPTLTSGDTQAAQEATSEPAQ
jgi:hypothetical protein